MKLKNKKTGDIVEFKTPACMVDEKYSYQYGSLAELNAEWEDVPTEEVWYLGERIGNYSMPKKEARKATEKILAWKRLKDKGFRFIPEFHRIEEGDDERGNIMFIACTMNDDKDFIYGDNKDLKLLFSEEEK